MIGLPGETNRTAEKTISTMIGWAEEGLVDTWEYKMYIPYPGTPIYETPESYGIRILEHDYRLFHYARKPVISTSGFTPSKLWSIHQKGLEMSASLLEAKFGSKELEIGVDLETIENMF